MPLVDSRGLAISQELTRSSIIKFRTFNQILTRELSAPYLDECLRISRLGAGTRGCGHSGCCLLGEKGGFMRPNSCIRR